MTLDINMNDRSGNPIEARPTPGYILSGSGSGADDNSLEIYAYIGNTWPFDKNTMDGIAETMERRTRIMEWN